MHRIANEGTGMSDRHTSIAPPTGKRVLAVGLSERVEELCAELLAPERFRTIGEHGPWLLERYREIVPTVLPDALRSMETGDRIDPASLETIRRSARAMRGCGVPLSVVLRGSIPALLVFGAVIHARDTGLSARDITVLMGRAALIAGELGACWAESWADARGAAPLGSGGRGGSDDGVSLAFVPVTGAGDGPVLEMLALVAAGQSNEQIAEAMDYSTQAVKWHLARLMRQWKVDNRAALVAVALVRGVLTTR
jgi:DNA-binding CsgD family transcriptional regulator